MSNFCGARHPRGHFTRELSTDDPRISISESQILYLCDLFVVFSKYYQVQLSATFVSSNLEEEVKYAYSDCSETR